MSKAPTIALFVPACGEWRHEKRHARNCSSYTYLPTSEGADILVLLAPGVETTIYLPHLDMSLPADNVRHSLEGCIGFPGSVRGHRYTDKRDATGQTGSSYGWRVWLRLMARAGHTVKGNAP